MNFYKTTAAFGDTACLLMASSALGTDVERQTFEGDLTGSPWLASGNDAEQVTLESAIAAPTPAGFPTAESTSTKALSIAGSATREYNASGDTMVDMMVKVSIPDEALTALDTASGGEAENAKFAVAVDTDGKFKYFTGSNGTPWNALSSTVYTEGAWVRITMKFDYTSTDKTCTVALDGNTCGTFPLIASASALASIEVKGSTAIDEVVVAQGTTPAFADTTAKAEGATYATKKWLTANDVTWPADSSAAARLDTQYKLGLDPKTAATTLPLAFEQDDSGNTATLSFPGFGAWGGTGAYYLDASPDNSTWTEGATALTVSGTGVNTATVALPSIAGQAIYYRVRAASN